ncbi:unnamed protein product [Angiostrongylus costaricensis]|uniref:EGF-like domain-containing protein n=1 Tax=Angiostrongylus costaricensis TaxID=334426 RepID=A0A158PE47_ANGCS|nr:unnamed protein product [Angiostrongylus costaricensis]
MSSSQSSRLWVGPLLLILVVALIYIFSLMPNSSHQRELPPLIDDAHHMRTFRLDGHEITESMENIKDGDHRECVCSGRLFGKACDLVCVEGYVVDGRCRCKEECEIPAKRRGAVNSRLTLSGLSFCMITIGLLCVTARRHRAGPIPPSEDTWYRVFQPAHTRAARHDLICGGSWIPRDRALLVTPGRSAVVHGSSRSSSRGRRPATPPPNYTSVGNLVDDQLPPTYEEATRYLENSPTSAALIQELIDETVQTLEAKEMSPEIAETSTNTTTTSVPTQTTQPDENITTTTTPTANIFSGSS